LTHDRKTITSLLDVITAAALLGKTASAPLKVNIDWSKTTSTSKPQGAVQLGPGGENEPRHKEIMQALRDLQADFVRYIPWYPAPKLAVAELYPPQGDRTFWDFALLDPPLEEFLKVTAGHTSIINFSTIPQWMFKTDKTVDLLKASFDYSQGSELRVSLKDVGDYYARLVSWYALNSYAAMMVKLRCGWPPRWGRVRKQQRSNVAICRT